jgi:exopolysaccharide biosynthesis polyprenyl glycosylphosphotransferase
VAAAVIDDRVGSAVTWPGADADASLRRARRAVSEVERGGSGTALRRRLVLTDLAMVVSGWSIVTALGWGGVTRSPIWWGFAATMVGLTMALILSAGLYRARVASVHATEAARLAFLSLAVGGVGAVANAGVLSDAADSPTVVGAAGSFLLLLGGRSIFRNWLLAQRATGKRLRAVVMIGADEEARRMADHLAEYPQIGYEVVGYLRSRHAVHQDATGHDGQLVLGVAQDAPQVLGALGVTGAIVVPGALAPDECDRVLSGLLAAHVHVHLSPGIRGVDSRRLRSSPMGHEPLLYLEPSGGTSAHYAPLRRVIDVVGASIGLLLTAPMTVVVALAIKLTDRGPVLFRQERAGKDGRTFMLLKFRSMSVDAESRLDELRRLNQREGGPLFKLESDPRVTRVGAILRATSFDEIPQLINVLRGEMSLVGPRPALVAETHEFDDELMVRQQVRPGVTGLWQVEARDNPSFSAYRYLDVFYVENQSLSLDVTILMATFRAVAMSCVRALRGRRRTDPEACSELLVERAG